MLTFIIEAATVCLVFTLTCFSLVGKTMKNLELAKLNYPEPIIQRLIGGYAYRPTKLFNCQNYLCIIEIKYLSLYNTLLN